MSDRPIFYTRWRVIDETGKVLFEGYYGEAVKFMQDNKLKNAKLEPFMYKRDG